MNETLNVLDKLIIGLEYFAIFVICVLFSNKLKDLFFGGEKDISSSLDSMLHSCFLTGLTVGIFHFSTSEIRDVILSVEVGKMELRRLFYFSMFMLEFSFALTLFTLHKFRKCKFSLAARLCLIFSVIICIVNATQFYIRGIEGLDFFVPIYKITVVLTNLLTLIVISIYPLNTYYQLKKSKVNI
jgi:hypothetical protein